MKILKTLLISAVLLLLGYNTVQSQDFTLSPYNKVKSDVIYEGSYVNNGDSATITFQGSDGTLIKDFAVSTAPGLLVGTTALRDTLVWTVDKPSFIRVKVVDSLGTKYSNYVDISMGNGAASIVPVHYSFQFVARTASTWTLNIVIRVVDLEAVPTRWLY